MSREVFYAVRYFQVVGACISDDSLYMRRPKPFPVPPDKSTSQPLAVCHEIRKAVHFDRGFENFLELI